MFSWISFATLWMPCFTTVIIRQIIMQWMYLHISQSQLTKKKTPGKAVCHRELYRASLSHVPQSRSCCRGSLPAGPYADQPSRSLSQAWHRASNARSWSSHQNSSHMVAFPINWVFRFFSPGNSCQLIACPETRQQAQGQPLQSRGSSPSLVCS